MIEQKSLKQDYRGQALEHVIVHDGTSRVLPTVIIMPTVMGCLLYTSDAADD